MTVALISEDLTPDKLADADFDYIPMTYKEFEIAQKIAKLIKTSQSRHIKAIHRYIDNFALICKNEKIIEFFKTKLDIMKNLSIREAIPYLNLIAAINCLDLRNCEDYEIAANILREFIV